MYQTSGRLALPYQYPKQKICCYVTSVRSLNIIVNFKRETKLVQFCGSINTTKNTPVNQKTCVSISCK